MKVVSTLLRAAGLFLACSEAVTAAPTITRSLMKSSIFTRRDFTQCGAGSQGGSQKCPFNTCCSASGWCGTTANYCNSLSQKEFGSSSIIEPPSCNGNSAAARKIGYYLAYAIGRPCNAVSPSDIDTNGLTHINFAFALFDSVNFDFYPEREGSESAYREFTALKTDNLQTWISIGGGGFNDPTSSTKNNWAIMANSSTNRATWINNLIAYMNTYGFQGADIDWEWPVDSSRGGTPADAVNFVALMEEMRAAFGTEYGLSVALVTNIDALQHIDVKEMEQYVDFFNFMSYDYNVRVDSHSSSDTALSGTDITLTDSKLTPLWFAGVSPAKINLGLAYYGASYTMTGSECSGVGCPYTSEGIAGACTGSPGLLSNLEINSIINAGGTTTTLISSAMVKQTTYSTNQLILYDDADTYELKTNYANSRCLGGTMIWSIDQGP